MSSQEITQVLRKISIDNEWFPILDLTEIIAEYIYETPTKCIQTLTGHNTSVWALTALKDGSIASGEINGVIKIWKNSSGYLTYINTSTFNEGDWAIFSLIESGNKLLSGLFNGNINIWGKKDSEYYHMQTISAHISEINSMIEINRDTLASCSWDRTIKI